MTSTMRRLGRVYAERVEKARLTALYLDCGVLHNPDVSLGYLSDRAAECATFGLEAMALRAVLREMAETRRALPVLRSMAWRSR